MRCLSLMNISWTEPEARNSNTWKSSGSPISTISLGNLARQLRMCLTTGEQWDSLGRFWKLTVWCWNVYFVHWGVLVTWGPSAEVGSLGREVWPAVLTSSASEAEPVLLHPDLVLHNLGAWSWSSGPVRGSLRPGTHQWLCCCCCSSLGSWSSSGGSHRALVSPLF